MPCRAVCARCGVERSGRAWRGAQRAQSLNPVLGVAAHLGVRSDRQGGRADAASAARRPQPAADGMADTVRASTITWLEWNGHRDTAAHRARLQVLLLCLRCTVQATALGGSQLQAGAAAGRRTGSRRDAAAGPSRIFQLPTAVVWTRDRARRAYVLFGSRAAAVAAAAAAAVPAAAQGQGAQGRRAAAGRLLPHGAERSCSNGSSTAELAAPGSSAT